MKSVIKQTILFSSIAIILAGQSACSDTYTGSLQGTRLETSQVLNPEEIKVNEPVEFMSNLEPVILASEAPSIQLQPVKLPPVLVNNGTAVIAATREVLTPSKFSEPKEVNKNKSVKRSRVPNSLTAVGLIMGFTGMAIAMIFGFLTTPLIGEPEFLIMMLGVGIGFFGAFATVLGIALARGNVPPVQQESIDETPVTPEPKEQHHDHQH